MFGCFKQGWGDERDRSLVESATNQQGNQQYHIRQKMEIKLLPYISTRVDGM